MCLSVLHVKHAPAEYATNASSFQIELRKIRCCGSCSPHNAEFGHFTLLFAEHGKEMY